MSSVYGKTIWFQDEDDDWDKDDDSGDDEPMDEEEDIGASY